MAKPRKPKSATKNGRSKTPAISSLSSHRERSGLDLDGEELLHLDKIYATLLSGAKRDLKQLHTSLDAETYGSAIWGLWWNKHLVDADAETVMSTGLRTYMLNQTSPLAGIILRAVGSVAPERFTADFDKANAEFASRGFVDPEWATNLDQQQPVRACKMFEPIHDDGIVIFIEFAHPDGPHSLNVLIDNNLGGIAKDAFIMPTTVAHFKKRFEDAGDGRGQIIDIGLDEAKAILLEAFDQTDHTYEPPVEDTFVQFRALALQRIASLPDGFTLPEPVALTEAERTTLVNHFMASDAFKSQTFSTPAATLEYLAEQIALFSDSYVVGEKLRFSPTMVELFLVDYAPRKIAGDQEDFAELSQLLKAWIAYVDQRRDIPKQATQASHRAVDQYETELLSSVGDQANWGPAKLMATALQQRSIDFQDADAVQAFVDEVNAGGGIDTLSAKPEPDGTTSLADARRKKR